MSEQPWTTPVRHWAPARPLAWEAPYPDDQEMGHFSYLELFAAAEGRHRYNRSRYPNHSISNNALELVWGGLLAYGPDGLVATDAGRARLVREVAEQRARDEQLARDSRQGPAKSPTRRGGAKPLARELNVQGLTDELFDSDRYLIAPAALVPIDGDSDDHTI